MTRHDPLQGIVFELSKLPGIGQKSAQRLAFHMLAQNKESLTALVRSIEDIRDHVKACQRCFHLTYDETECVLCQDTRRDGSTLCVVSDPRDVIALEKMGRFRGLYHVLGGVISPLDGIGPDKLHIRELLERLKTEPVTELIFALSPSVEGETTTMYLSRLLKPLDLKLSQIAYGIPMGGELEWVDEMTLGRAFDGRRAL